MISRVGDVEVAVVVEGESCGVVELCDGSRAVFVGGRAVTCEGGDVAEGIDFADAVVVFVGDVEVAVVVEGESARGGESGLLACSVGKAFGVGADKSADAPVFFDLSDAMVPFVGDVKVVLAIEGKGAWGVECGVEFSNTHTTHPNYAASFSHFPRDPLALFAILSLFPFCSPSSRFSCYPLVLFAILRSLSLSSKPSCEFLLLLPRLSLLLSCLSLTQRRSTMLTLSGALGYSGRTVASAPLPRDTQTPEGWTLAETTAYDHHKPVG